jgi:hypothetical protein
MKAFFSKFFCSLVNVAVQLDPLFQTIGFKSFTSYIEISTVTIVLVGRKSCININLKADAVIPLISNILLLHSTLPTIRSTEFIIPNFLFLG